MKVNFYWNRLHFQESFRQKIDKKAFSQLAIIYEIHFKLLFHVNEKESKQSNTDKNNKKSLEKHKNEKPKQDYGNHQ